MRVLAIDPGLVRTGYGVIESQGSRLIYRDSGTLRPVTRLSVAERLRFLFDEITALMLRWQPDRAAVEHVFVNVNPRSTLLLGQARGVALAAVSRPGLPVDEFDPTRIKQSVVGTGRAEKEQVQVMVKRLLNLTQTIGTDEADALACAICALNHASMPMPDDQKVPNAGRAHRAGRLQQRTAWASLANQRVTSAEESS